MLSYRHGFHAGNFADVLKHAVLSRMLAALRSKEKPFCYLETHAGAGCYDLRDKRALKNAEFRSGIARVWKQSDVPEYLNDYLAAVRASNQGGELRRYPGSPLIARRLLRQHDRMVLCELHSTEIVALRRRFAGDRQVIVYHQDGYSALKALLPPAERRGLVLCDPAYEVRDERLRMFNALIAARAKWPTGMFAIWHPIQQRAVTERLYRKFKGTGIPKILLVELCVRPDDETNQLKGSGMILINPPWQLDEEVKDLLPWLKSALVPEGTGNWRVEWLTSEEYQNLERK